MRTWLSDLGAPAMAKGYVSDADCPEGRKNAACGRVVAEGIPSVLFINFRF